MTEIPIGYVGVVVSYVGREHLDVSGDDFTHGDLVERGRKGVWVEPLLPGKHPVNTRVMKVELVPTTNIVLNWAHAHRGAQLRREAAARSPCARKDGFASRLDVSQIIHIGMKAAPRVISRVGSMQNLVDHVLQPTVANYFRNSAQEVTVLEFLSARSAAPEGGVRRHPGGARGLRRGVHRHADRRHRAAGGADEDPDRPEDRRRAAAHLRGAARGAGEAPGAGARDGGGQHAGRGGAQRADGAHQPRRTRSRGRRDRPRARRRRSGSAPRPRPMPSGSGARPRRPRRAPSARPRPTPIAWASPPSVRRASPPSEIAGVLAEHGVRLVPDIAVSGDGASGGLATAMLGRVLAGTDAGGEREVTAWRLRDARRDAREAPPVRRSGGRSSSSAVAPVRLSVRRLWVPRPPGSSRRCRRCRSTRRVLGQVLLVVVLGVVELRAPRGSRW